MSGSVRVGEIEESPTRLSTVREYSNGALIMEDGWSIGLDADPGTVHIGDVVAIWGEIGRPVRGLATGGMVHWYRTEAEEHARHAEWVANKRTEDIRKFEETGRAECDAIYAKLPHVFQRRIDRFREGNTAFRWKFEEYELSVCVDAVKIADHCGTVERVAEFANLPYADQMKIGLFDGHSGNSFDAALHLARLFLTNRDLVVDAHGALVPLVGCVDYGCTHRRETMTTSSG